MLTTVLIENALTLVVVGTAFQKSRKTVLLTMIIAIIAYMGFDHHLLSSLHPASSAIDHQAYYTLNSLFFLAMFGLFIVRITKLSIIMSGLMIVQAILCFLMAMNGASIDGVKFYEFDFIYQIHEWFNNLIWGAECVVVYAASFTGDE